MTAATSPGFEALRPRPEVVELAEEVDVEVGRNSGQDDGRLLSRIGEAVPRPGRRRDQGSRLSGDGVAAAGEGRRAGHDKEGLIVLAVNVLWRPAGSRWERNLDEPDAVPGVTAIFEDPVRDGTG